MTAQAGPRAHTDPLQWDHLEDGIAHHRVDARARPVDSEDEGEAEEEALAVETGATVLAQ